MANKRRNNRIPAANLSKTTLPLAHAPEPPGLVVFSFKYLDLKKTGKFSHTLCEDGWHRCFLQRLHDVSRMAMSALRDDNRNTALRNHAIKWNETTEPSGFSQLPKQLQPDTPWQFSLTSNLHGRVHGFILSNTFYVVWIDPDHSLYRSK